MHVGKVKVKRKINWSATVLIVAGTLAVWASLVAIITDSGIGYVGLISFVIAIFSVMLLIAPYGRDDIWPWFYPTDAEKYKLFLLKQHAKADLFLREAEYHNDQKAISAYKKRLDQVRKDLAGIKDDA